MSIFFVRLERQASGAFNDASNSPNPERKLSVMLQPLYSR
jgi:hypothetical protein